MIPQMVIPITEFNPELPSPISHPIGFVLCVGSVKRTSKRPNGKMINKGDGNEEEFGNIQMSGVREYRRISPCRWGIFGMLRSADDINGREYN